LVIQDDGAGRPGYHDFFSAAVFPVNASTDSRDKGAPSWAGTPLVRVVLSQAIGAAVALGAAFAGTAATGIAVPLFAVLVAMGVVAAWIGTKLRLARWWIPVQMALPPAAALVSLVAIPAWLYLTAFVLLGLVYWNSARNRVPLYLTNRATWEAIAKLIPDGPGRRFLDIGHGIGGVLFFLSHRRPDAELTGIESAPLLFIISRLRARLKKAGNIDFRYGDFWKLDLSGYDVVYAFLSTAPMAALFEKAQREMKPGALFISNSFAVPGTAPTDTVMVNDRRKTKLYVWRIPHSS
jgi:hypothetical protein